jgi:hypothetical protein
MSQIVFSLDPKLASDNAFQIIFDEFKLYKERGNANEHPAPTRRVQETLESTHEQFGRDRFDSKHVDAKEVDLRHVHVEQENSIWSDANGDLYQWYCTSDSYLVYSYFEHDVNKYYHVIEFFTDSGHALYGENVRFFVATAIAYKKSILGN